MSLDARRAAEALMAAGPDLVRVWRSARAAERPGIFPGFLDALVEPFLAVAAEALADGRHPALLWSGLAGVVRVDARDPARTRSELDVEWALLEHVLHAACQALDADADVRDWIARAVAIARGGARRLPEREGAPGILTVRVFSGIAPTRRVRAPSPP
jgi:hypothetical protein